jgi:hypothetical protein
MSPPFCFDLFSTAEKGSIVMLMHGTSFLRVTHCKLGKEPPDSVWTVDGAEDF